MFYTNKAIDFATSSAASLVSIEFKCGFPLLHMYDNQAIEWTIIFTIQGSPGTYNEETFYCHIFYGD